MALLPHRTAPQAVPAAPPRSRYAGIVGANQRDPMLGTGLYRVRVISCAEGTNPGKMRDSFKATLHVLSAAEGSETPVGSNVTFIAFLHTQAGLGELKRFAFYAAGYGPTLQQRSSPNVKELVLQGEAEYNALDESVGGEGSILDASTGKANGCSLTLIGRLVDVIVTKGKPVPNPQTGEPTGDYFRVYSWGVVPDTEQDA